jgi:hypothetical protein
VAAAQRPTAADALAVGSRCAARTECVGARAADASVAADHAADGTGVRAAAGAGPAIPAGADDAVDHALALAAALVATVTNDERQTTMSRTKRQQAHQPFRSTATIAKDLNLQPGEVRALGKRLGVKRRGNRLQWSPSEYLQLVAIVGDVDIKITATPPEEEE